MTSYIFDCLRKEWVEKRGYSLEDLKYITSGMDVLYDEFDPRLFVNNSNLFIKKLKEFEKKMATKDNSKMTETTANRTELVVGEFELDISVSFDELYDSKMDLKNELKMV